MSCSPERPMSAALQKRISFFKMERLKSEDASLAAAAHSDSEMIEAKKEERAESARRRLSNRMQKVYAYHTKCTIHGILTLFLRLERRRSRRHGTSALCYDDDDAVGGASDSEALTPTVDELSGTALIVNKDEVKQKMKELERLFKLKKKVQSQEERH